MAFRQFFSSKLRASHDTFVGKTGSITYYEGNLYYHDGRTPGGLRIDQDDGTGIGYATEEWVDGRIASVVGTAPAALDTLKELADALGNDADFATSITNLLASKSDIVYVDSEITNLNSSVNTRLATKASTTYVDTEIADLQDAINLAIQTLQTALDNETNARIAGDDDLQNQIDNEVLARTSGDADLQDSIDAEAATRGAADLSLQASIAAVNTDLANEENARIAGDQTLDSKIDAEIAARQAGNSTLQTSINDEATARAAADALLQTAIDTESSTRETADTALQNNIDAEATARESADTTLQSNIDAEVAARGSAISAEASVRANADNTLQSNIDAEEAARIAGDTALQANLDAVEASYIAADSAMQADIDQEISDRIAAVNGLQSDLSDETTAREAADAALQSQIDFIKTNVDPAAIDSLSELLDAYQNADLDIANNITTINLTLGTLANADSNLQSAIDAEATAREDADANLQTQIDFIKDNIDPAALDSLTEIVAAFQADDGSLLSTLTTVQTDLQAAIDAESAARQTRDGQLETGIDTVAANLSTEVAARASADTTLQGNIDAEESARIDADTLLQSNIDAEATARQNVDDSLQASIDAEAALRQAGDDTLQSNIDGLSASLISADSILQSSIDAEASARADADTTLQSNIDAEASARADADTTLQSNIDAAIATEAAARQARDSELETGIDTVAADLTTEINDRQAADATLQSNIDSEEAARIAADTTLQTNISAEAVARVAADADLQSQIDNIVSNTDPAALDSLTEILAAFQGADGDLANTVTSLQVSLSADIAAEETARIAADNNLQTQITGVAGSLATVATTGSYNDLTDKPAAADLTGYATETYVTDSIATETSARTTADADLQSQIDSLSSGALTVGNVETEISKSVPAGALGQLPFIKTDGTRETEQDYVVKLGQFIETNDELTVAQTRIVTNADVFNTWERFSHNNTETQPASPSDANAWVYDSVNDRFVCTTNTSTLVGFVSPDRYSDYLLEVQLLSTDSDNDTIGLLIAWYVDPDTGRQYTLTALRDTGGNGNAWEIWYNYRRSDARLIADGSASMNIGSGWANYPNGTLVKITRAGDSITAETTQLDSSTYLTGSAVLTVDLTSDPDLAKFRGPKSYGYVAYSQGQASFNVLAFSGGSNSIYDMRDGGLYTYVNGSWTLSNTSDIWQEIGVGRLVHDIYTKKTFFIESETSITKVAEPTGTLDYNDLTNTPTNVSTFTNDSGYITIADLTGYATETYVSNATASAQNYTDQQVIMLQGDISNATASAQNYTDQQVIMLQGDISNASATLSTSIVNLGNTTDAMIQDEANTRASADITLQANIDTQATRITNLGNTTDAMIQDEANTRASADITLQANIDTLSNSLVSYATIVYVDNAVANLVNTAPAALDTLSELAAALGNDENFATTVSTEIGLKANSADLATVATTGSYNDLTNTPTIPGVGNFTLSGNTIRTSNGDGGIDLYINGADSNEALIERKWRFASDGSIQFIDPFFSSATATITDTKVGNWDTAYGWGDHSQAGYLTSVTVPTAVSELTNDSGYITSTVEGVLTVNGSVIGNDTGIIQGFGSIQGNDTGIITGFGSIQGNDSGIITGFGSIQGNDTGIISGFSAVQGNNTGIISGFIGMDIGAKSVNEITIQNWDDAYGWGDHSLAGYATENYVTTTIAGSDWGGITTSDISNWNTAYGWGDHSLSGYATEVYVNTTLNNYATTAYVDAATTGDWTSVTSGMITNWNTAFDWGDHASENYVKSVNGIVPAAGALTLDLGDLNNAAGYATTTYVDNAVSNLVNAAPETLNTLNELAAALNNDADFATTVSTQLGAKANAADLATVATSGDYNDLINLPTIGAQDRVVSGDYSVILDSAGTLVLSSGSGIIDSGAVICNSSATTSIYTARNVSVSSIKLIIQAESLGSAEVQASEMMIVRVAGTNTVASSVYGTVYSGSAALASFAAAINVDGYVEVTCQPVANQLHVKVIATEIISEND